MSELQSFQVAVGNACLDCGEPLDGAAPITGKTGPQPGDISVCFSCGHIMAFGEGATLRPLTDAEMLVIAGDPQIVRIRRALHKFKSKTQEGSRG